MKIIKILIFILVISVMLVGCQEEENPTFLPRPTYSETIDKSNCSFLFLDNAWQNDHVMHVPTQEAQLLEDENGVPFINEKVKFITGDLKSLTNYYGITSYDIRFGCEFYYISGEITELRYVWEDYPEYISAGLIYIYNGDDLIGQISYSYDGTFVTKDWIMQYIYDNLVVVDVQL